MKNVSIMGNPIWSRLSETPCILLAAGGGVAIELHRGNVGGGVYLDIFHSANYPLNYTGGLLVILSLIWTISELHSRCIGHIDTHLNYKWTTEMVSINFWRFLGVIDRSFGFFFNLLKLLVIFLKILVNFSKILRKKNS